MQETTAFTVNTNVAAVDINIAQEVAGGNVPTEDEVLREEDEFERTDELES